VVPSPRPLRLVEIDTVGALADAAAILAGQAGTTITAARH
jgi:hypothetical protein